MKPNRRRLFRLAAGAAGCAALSGFGAAHAEVHLSQADPIAQALNYRDDAVQVDQSNSRYVPGSACGNCQLYQGKPAEVAGNCPIFRKLVSAKGWCNSYVKKA